MDLTQLELDPRRDPSIGWAPPCVCAEGEVSVRWCRLDGTHVWDLEPCLVCQERP